mgnify:CR=1 FL=1
MVKESTLNKTYEILQLIKQSGLTIAGYFRTLGKNPRNLYVTMGNIRNQYDELKDKYPVLVDNILELHKNITSRDLTLDNIEDEVSDTTEDEVLDTDEKVESSYVRNSEGKIVGYKFKVFRRDKTPVTGVLSREEMQSIYRLYSYYGASITQREVSRHFPDYSLVDFKRILRAFNITKASGPFAPHMYEEKSEEELKDIHLREKENDFLKKIEKDELRDVQNTAIKLARKNRELEETIEQLSKNISIDIKPFDITPEFPYVDSDKSMIIHLADMHIGAKCESNTLYPNPYDYDEIKRRLDVLIRKIESFGHLDTLIINLLGDSLDGMDNQTARRDHLMPQEMDNMQQLETFIDLTLNFICNCRNLANKVKVYCVKCGNHGGMWEYTANLALQCAVEKTFPDVEFTLFKDFFGWYNFKEHVFVCCHGKDEKFMKRALPLNLDERSKVMIHEWLTDTGLITAKHIHFIKGDLHSNALNSCRLFDYRNVLSLFGASDYSNYNFSRNSYGVSYDLFTGNNRTIGTFENL